MRITHAHPLQSASTNLHVGHGVVDVDPTQALVQRCQPRKIHCLSGVIAVWGGGRHNVGEGVFESGRNTVIGPVGYHARNAGKGDEGLRQGS